MAISTQTKAPQTNGQKYLLEIEIDERGWPTWLHDPAAEAALTPAQRVTYNMLRGFYKGVQHALSWNSHEQGALYAESLLHHPLPPA